jgi:hypothetical protein
VVHGFPVLLSGCYDTSCIRGIRDVTHWLASVQVDTGRDITHTRSKFLEKLTAVEVQTGSPSASVPNNAGSPSALADTGSASIFNPDPVSYKLAQDLSNSKVRSFFVSSTKPIPKFIEPTTTRCCFRAT